jgi:methyl-accepting chemotaxis protein
MFDDTSWVEAACSSTALAMASVSRDSSATAEVKELAGQTAKATGEITQRIGDIQGATGEAVARTFSAIRPVAFAASDTARMFDDTSWVEAACSSTGRRERHRPDRRERPGGVAEPRRPFERPDRERGDQDVRRHLLGRGGLLLDGAGDGERQPRQLRHRVAAQSLAGHSSGLTGSVEKFLKAG